MSLFKRAINIIKSNINANKVNSVSFDDIDLSSFSTSGQNEYEEFSQTASEDDYLSPDEKLEKEYYGNLELTVGASFDEIKKQYRVLLKKYHPDKFNNDEKKRRIAEQVVSKLNTAYNYFENKYKT